MHKPVIKNTLIPNDDWASEERLLEIRKEHKKELKTDKKKLLEYLDRIDKCLYNKYYDGAKIHLYDLYNHIRISYLVKDKTYIEPIIEEDKTKRTKKNVGK